MTRLPRALRQTLTIARRDFIATVFTPIFLIFLFAPVIMGSFGAIGGLGAASVTAGAADRTRVVAIAAPREAALLRDADAALRPLFPGDGGPPALELHRPGGDAMVQARAALATPGVDVVAVMAGSLERPQILRAADARRSGDYLAALADRALRVSRDPRVHSAPRVSVVDRVQPNAGKRNASAFFAVFGIFFLTLFLSGQVVGTMAEERNNKVIEVLAAAVPLESVFLGKLVGMFGVAVLFVTFWGVVLSQVSALLPGGGLAGMAPAVGTGVFAFLFAAYFAMAYLLLGSVFLGVGAQASTMREIQMLSLPITIVQVAMFGLSSAAVSHPGSWVATLAEIFPLSSPFAMAGRAVNSPDLWPHLLALGWQALWVAIFVMVGARLFRRGVLQSGSPAGAWRKLFNQAEQRADRAGY
ncbi:ABC transporter permease [Sphingomonas sp. TX0543]|uniref:ABC transporter permease n=1 Tax=unclassified Sphingomonas TaxID=196159 RepID=UPI0010F75A43|nr:ABC transporter permease [Sphingomonas sp. 3P27F8]